jgi:hypothetical protein
VEDDHAAADRPFTLAEFYERNRISASSYVKLRKRGQGAREMRVLSRVFITPQAEADWRRDRETPDSNDAETIERLHHRGHKGARRSVAKRRRNTA